jgi:hypothetical protein
LSTLSTFEKGGAKSTFEKSGAKAKPKFNIIYLIILKKIENYLFVLNNRKNG